MPNSISVHWNNSNCEKAGKDLLRQAKEQYRKRSEGFKSDTEAVAKEAATYFRSKAKSRTYSFSGQTRRG